MTFVKINGTLYPATIIGRKADNEWDNRNSKSITLEMTYAEAVELFINGLAWSIVQREDVPTYKKDENGNYILDENGEPIVIETQDTEFDNSDYNLAGDITDHRDGTITVKMGKLTELEEAYEIMLGGVEDELVPEDAEISEIEGEDEPIPEDAEVPEVEGDEPIPEDTESSEVEGENGESGDITEGGIE